MHEIYGHTQGKGDRKSLYFMDVWTSPDIRNVPHTIRSSTLEAGKTVKWSPPQCSFNDRPPQPPNPNPPPSLPVPLMACQGRSGVDTPQLKFVSAERRRRRRKSTEFVAREAINTNKTNGRFHQGFRTYRQIFLQEIAVPD